MENNEFSTMYKTIFFLLVEAAVVGYGLSRLAYYTSAGDISYQWSLAFVATSALVVILAYTFWYRKVNKVAAELYNIEEKRAAARHFIPKYLVLSLLFTAIILGGGIAAMFFHLIFAGIDKVFCYSAVAAEFVIGNLTLVLMMGFFALPDRVTGRY